MKTLFFALLISLPFLICCDKKKDSISPSNSGIAATDTSKKDSAIYINGKIQFHVKSFRNTSGNLLVALYNSSTNYTNGNRFRSFVSAIQADSLVFSFDSIPPGTYCMSCFHDENQNNNLDKNFFGIPTEGFGFSNNPAITAGAPSFTQIKFTVDTLDTLLLNVNLIYF